jgi:predicted permease
MLVGLTCTIDYFPQFFIGTLDQLKACMGPLAMLLAGITIANYDFKKLWSNKRVYIATLLRLVVLPAILVGTLIGLRAALNSIFELELSNQFVYFAFFATAMPLGMNTIVFPEAYGGDPEPGASMAIVSSAFSIITIPLLYSILTLILPDLPFIIV